jgi:hypothetical protein
MSSFPQRRRFLFGFDATDWLFLASGIVLAAVFAAIFVF